jgi:Fe-S cluster biosynthesis and repair protein YggX
MKKLIKNYTTEVPLQKTITEIHHLLAENGATGIATEYDKGRIRDIFFKIKVTGKELAFRLPAKPDKVYAALHGQTMSHYHDRYGEQWHDQAERVAWRICKSWLEAQITLINLEQAKMEEVFLPYLVVGKNNESLYEVMKDKQFLLPSGT